MTNEHRSLRQKMATSALLLVTRRIAVMGLSLLSTSVVAHYVSTRDFGHFASATATYYVALAVADLGFGMVLARRIPTEQENSGALMRSGIRLQLTWAIVLAVAIAIAALVAGPGTTKNTVLLIMAPSIAISGFTAIRQLFLIAYETRTLMRVDLLTNTLQALITVGVVLAGGGVVGAAIVLSLSAIVNALLSLRAGRSLIDDGQSSRAMRRSMLREALPLGIGSVLASLYFSIDLMILPWLVGDEALGWYAAAAKVLSLLVTVPNLMAAAVLPGLAESSVTKENLSKTAAAIWSWLLVAAMPLCLLVAVFAEFFMTTLYGARYHDARDVAVVLSLAGVVALASNVLGGLMVTARRGRAMLVQNLIALTFNVGANVVLAPRYGIVASAWVTVATEIMVCTASYLRIRRAISLRPVLAATVRPAIALSGLVISGLALMSLPVVGLVVSVVVFLILMTVLQAWPDEIVERIRRRRSVATTPAR